MPTTTQREQLDALLATLVSQHGEPDAALDATIRGDSPVSTSPPRAAPGVATSSKAHPLGAVLPGISIAESLGAAAGDADGARASSPVRTADIVVRKLLGAGGMGMVHLGYQRSLDRDVAIKRVLDPGAMPAAVAALLSEATTSGRLEHPNIVPVHSLGMDDRGSPVLVMKRVEGFAWRELIRDAQHPHWTALGGSAGDRLVRHLEILSSVCNALHFAHSRGVVHRDVKPDNVMIGEFGEVYVLDWGVALRRDLIAADALPQTVGTPVYMAPEMVAGDPREVDERTDVYLLGSTLHEVLVGTCRHDAPDLHAALTSALLSETFSYDASVPAELAQLCNDSMHVEPSRRPATAEAFRRRIDDFLRHRGSLALSRAADDVLSRAVSIASTDGLVPDTSNRADVGRQLTEARFGYVQALREWPENAAARSGLQRCIEAMIEREFEQRSPIAVRSLLAELPERRPEIERRLEQLEAEIAFARERDEQLRRQAIEQDSSVSLRSRMLVLVGIFAAFIATSVDATRRELRTGLPPPIRDSLRFDAILIALVGLGIFLGRRKLLVNEVSRRMTWVGALAIAFGCISDVFAAARGLDSRIASMYAMLVLAAGFGVAGVTLMRGLLVAAASQFVGACVAALVPWLATVAGTFAMITSIVTVMLISLRHARGSHERVAGRAP